MQHSGPVFPLNEWLKISFLIQWGHDCGCTCSLAKGIPSPAASPNPPRSSPLQPQPKTLNPLQVLVEGEVAAELPEYETFDAATSQVDFCITLGGDGTVLHLASLFEEDVPLPPTLSFAMGTLGFLTPFNVRADLAAAAATPE